MVSSAIVALAALQQALGAKEEASRWYGELTLTATLDAQKGFRKNGMVYFAVPSSDRTQDVKFALLSKQRHRITASYENDLVFLEPDGRPVQFEIKMSLKKLDLRPEIANYEKNEPGQVPSVIAKNWLKPGVVVDSSHPSFKRIADFVRQPHPVATVRKVLQWMDKFFGKKNVFPELPASRSLARGQGECAANSMVFVGICQAAGVPARVVQGLVGNDFESLPVKGSLGTHMWAEVYFAGLGWVPVEPQRPESLGFLEAGRFLHPYIKQEHWDPTVSQYLPLNGYDISGASNLGIMTGTPFITYVR